LRALRRKMSVHFLHIRNILRPFGIFYGRLVISGNLVYFSPFWYIVSRKIWQPWSKCRQDCHNYCLILMTQPDCPLQALGESQLSLG
jgi:hypothetical protein